MTAIEAVQTVPLVQMPDGTIRITGTRVSLDTILHHYKRGASAEEIANRFQGVPLRDVYATIAYYLSHQEELDAYLRQQEAEEEALQRQLESDPEYQANRVAFRELLLQRWAERQKSGA
ncbi:MAG: DUF433 domain-containing protein [Gammaproteobacteria bacterium]